MYEYVSCKCCAYQVEPSATECSLVQRSPTELGLSSKCDHEASTMTWSWPTRECYPMETNASFSDKIPVDIFTRWKSSSSCSRPPRYDVKSLLSII